MLSLILLLLKITKIMNSRIITPLYQLRLTAPPRVPSRTPHHHKTPILQTSRSPPFHQYTNSPIIATLTNTTRVHHHSLSPKYHRTPHDLWPLQPQATPKLPNTLLTTNIHQKEASTTPMLHFRPLSHPQRYTTNLTMSSDHEKDQIHHQNPGPFLHTCRHIHRHRES